MIYLDQLKVKDQIYFEVKYFKEDDVHEHFIYDLQKEAEECAQKLSEKRSCEVISSLPKKKSKKA